MSWKVWGKGSRESHEPQNKDHVLSVGLPLSTSNQTQLEMAGVTHGCISQSSPYTLRPSLLPQQMNVNLSTLPSEEAAEEEKEQGQV